MGQDIQLDVVAGKGGVKRLLLSGLSHAQYRQALTLPGAIEKSRTANDGMLTFPVEPLRVADFHRLGNLTLTDAAAEWCLLWGKRVASALWIAGLDGINPIPYSDTTTPWMSKLYPYQRVGAWWLQDVRRGILGDEMGLGKTLQALAAVRDAKRVLVVTVNMAKNSVWAKHIADPAWVDGQVFVAEGNQRVETIDLMLGCQSAYLVINHEMLQARHAKKYKALYTTVWDAVILDEAHRFQDPQSSQSRGAARLRARRMYLLTGTPVWNRPESLFGLLHLLDKQRWSSYWHFVEEYCDVAVTPWAREIVGIKQSKVEQLKQVIAPYLLRRDKATVLPQLPPKRVQTIAYDLPPENRKAYRTLRKEFRLTLPSGALVRIEPNVSKAFSDLRRFLNSPALLDLPFPDPKTEAIDGLLDEALSEGRSVVIFAWHQDYISHLAKHLGSRGVDHQVISGATPQSYRETALIDFAVGDCKVLIAGISVMGTAVDLTTASVAIFAEGSYVSTHIQQAEDRLHRIGQKTDVMIYRMEAAHTVESALWSVVDDRVAVADELLAFRALAVRVLDDEDD